MAWVFDSNGILHRTEATYYCLFDRRTRAVADFLFGPCMHEAWWAKRSLLFLRG
jgi:hypothetical protein